MLDLFSGIGGFSLAASWTNQIKTVAFCEIDPFCQKVLKKHWPDVPIFDDITRLRGDDIGTADIITGGFPCQPFSCAGKRRGKEDDRFLWPEMLRVISEARPAWVIGENVAGFIGMGLDDCVSDLENQGYEVQAFVIPACAVNAPHRRDRVWIVANRSNTRLKDVRRERQNSILQISNTSDTSQQLFDGSGNSGQGWRDEYSDSGCNASDTTLRQDHGRRPGIMAEAERERECFNPSSGIGDQALENAISSGMRGRCDGDKAGGECSLQAEGPDCNAPDASDTRLQRSEWPGTHEQRQAAHGSVTERNHAWDEPWIEAATRLCRVDDGVSNRVDRLKALGNSIVPQVAYQIFIAIVEEGN